MPAADRTAVALVRRFTLGSGALRRGSDRLQFTARLLLVVALLTAVPVGLAVGSAAYEHAEGRAVTEAADRHSETARLLEDARTPPEASADVVRPARARVSWTVAPWSDRQERVVSVPSGAVAGSTTTIWLDAQGRFTAPPLQSNEVLGLGLSSGVGAFVAVAMLGFLAYQASRALIDRSRVRRWAADWAVVEPVWSRRVP